MLTAGSTTSVSAAGGVSQLVSSYRDYVDIRGRSQSFDALVAFTDLTAGFAIDRNAVPAWRSSPSWRVTASKHGGFVLFDRVSPRRCPACAG